MRYVILCSDHTRVVVPHPPNALAHGRYLRRKKPYPKREDQTTLKRSVIDPRWRRAPCYGPGTNSRSDPSSWLTRLLQEETSKRHTTSAANMSFQRHQPSGFCVNSTGKISFKFNSSVEDSAWSAEHRSTCPLALVFHTQLWYFSEVYGRLYLIRQRFGHRSPRAPNRRPSHKRQP